MSALRVALPLLPRTRAKCCVTPPGSKGHSRARPARLSAADSLHDAAGALAVAAGGAVRVTTAAHTFGTDVFARAGRSGVCLIPGAARLQLARFVRSFAHWCLLRCESADVAVRSESRCGWNNRATACGPSPRAPKESARWRSRRR